MMVGTTNLVAIPSYRSIQIEPDEMDDGNNNNNNIDYLSDTSLHSSSNIGQPENEEEAPHRNDDTTNDHDDHRRLSSSSSPTPPPPPLSIVAAALALMKGNLGPGILNLPHAFSQLYSSTTTSDSSSSNTDQEAVASSIPSPTMIILVLFSIVTIQGLYSMALLVYCKNSINQFHMAQSASNVTPPAVVVSTFMDVTKVTFGSRGGRITESLIFVVQIGVCCVFMSLISTNIQVFVQPMMTITPFFSLSFITLFFIITVTIFRYIHDLFYFNAIANTFMLLAILTVTITSISIILQQQHQNRNDHLGEVTSINDTQQERRIDDEEGVFELQQDSSSSSSTTSIVILLQAAITFIADLFFAFEGIGLVLPVENNYTTGTMTPATTTVTPNTTNYYSGPNQHTHVQRTNSFSHPATRTVLSTDEQISNNDFPSNDDDEYYHLHNQPQQQHRLTFTSVLLMSMGSVAILFAIIGFTSSIAFRHVNGNVGIQNASITAFLQETYPNNAWYPVINVMVVLAVAMTFPLQLTPAMEVLDKWLLECRCCRCNLPQLLGSRYHYFYPHFFPVSTLSRTDSDDDMVMQRMDNYVGNRNTTRATTGDAMYIHPPEIDSSIHRHRSVPSSLSGVSSLCNDYGWMVRRWLVVLSCSTIVLVVNDLGLLVSLFGAVGQTGLAAMPCAVHLALQYQQHIAPKNVLLTIADVLVLLFCMIVMVSGCYLSIHDILNKTT